MLNSHQVLAFKQKLTGQTDPYLIEIDSDQAAVVKLICKQGCVCFKEHLAIQMANALGLETLTAIQIEISPKFIATLPPEQLAHRLFSQHNLPAFGTYYLPGGRTPMGQDLCNVQLLTQIFQIFCFDILILNVDRTPANPNMLLFTERQSGSKLFVIDHEMAFPYSAEPDDSDPTQTSWRLSPDECLKFQSHCLHKPLKAALLDDPRHVSQIHAFVAKAVDLFTEPFWEKAQAEAPVPWRNTEEYARIKTRISAALANRPEFIEMIEEVIRQ